MVKVESLCSLLGVGKSTPCHLVLVYLVICWQCLNVLPDFDQGLSSGSYIGTVWFLVSICTSPYFKQ